MLKACQYDLIIKVSKDLSKENLLKFILKIVANTRSYQFRNVASR